ncbi:MAG TPA: hypothetical protein VGD48_06790 [Kutzneria sp.]|jgi:hypothetical protein
MADLSITRLCAAVRTHTDYLPLTAFPDDLLPKQRVEAAIQEGIPVEHLIVVNPADSDLPELSDLALAAVGVPDDDQPLFLIRSGPLRDPMVTLLARMVLKFGWRGEDIGITHLDELGGTVGFELLDWAIPDVATVLICDEPVFADARVGTGRFATVGLRVRQGPGPLLVLDAGEGAPESFSDVEWRFTGSGACDGWLDVHAALSAGDIADGDRILLHTKGPLREGWLLAQVVDAAAVELA